MSEESKVAALSQALGAKWDLSSRESASLGTLTCGLLVGAHQICWGHSLGSFRHLGFPKTWVEQHP